MRLTQRRPARSLSVLATIGALFLTGCGTQSGTPGGETDSASGSRTIRAQQFMRLTGVHDETGMTLLEGPVFGEDGGLYVVDVTAPEGKPKVLRVDVRRKTSRAVHTDGRGAYTSAQFSPYDGRLHLSDFAHGEIVSLAPGGGDPRTVFSGDVDGEPMNPDDIAFDPSGNLYVSDSRGLSEGTARGRVVRIDRKSGEATVLADDLAAPNGISFDAGYRGLWFSELIENRISYLRLDEEGAVTSRHTAIRVDGGIAQTDSIAVDADGNLYQGLHGRAAMAVFSPHGERLATVELPARAKGLESATNMAITPGGTKAYLTVSGPAGATSTPSTRSPRAPASRTAAERVRRCGPSSLADGAYRSHFDAEQPPRGQRSEFALRAGRADHRCGDHGDGEREIVPAAQPVLGGEMPPQGALHPVGQSEDVSADARAAAHPFGVEEADEGRRVREMPRQHPEHPGEGRVPARRLLLDLPDVLLQDRRDRGGPVGEVPVEDALPDPGPARYRRERGFQAVFREDLPGGGDESGPVAGGGLRPVVRGTSPVLLAALHHPGSLPAGPVRPPPRPRRRRRGGIAIVEALTLAPITMVFRHIRL